MAEGVANKEDSTVSAPGTILHVDMDAFFAAVEQRDHPEWRGKPVVVGSPPDKRGVVATCSYEARRYGIHSAMPSRTAYRLCPHAIFVPVRGQCYSDVSDQLMEIFHSFTPWVEQVSIDEAFLEVAGALKLYPDPVAVARALKQRIREQLRLTASVGVASNKFLAKLASDMNKPDGLTVVPTAPEAVLAFLAPLPIRRIWGVGAKTAEQLNKLGIHTIGDLQKFDLTTLVRFVGQSLAMHLYRLARGIDDRTIVTDREEKSISNEETFEHDLRDREQVRTTLIMLTEKVGRRLRKAGKMACTGQLKLRYEDFTTITRQQPFSRPTCSDAILLKTALELFERAANERPVRLVGFGVTNLGTPEEFEDRQLKLFPDENDGPLSTERQAALDQALDELRDKFGKNIIRRGL